MAQALLSKNLIRQAFRTNLSRDDHDQSLLRKNTDSLVARLSDFLKNQSGIWAAFEPVGFEPDIRHAVVQSTHLTWVYPRVDGDTLKFYKVGSREDLIENKWQILEPNPDRAVLVHVSELSGLLIPGLAFDETCSRLGRGRGFYDRALEEIFNHHQNLKTSAPLKIGVALERQVSVTALPVDPHDIVMDRVITESRILERP